MWPLQPSSCQARRAEMCIPKVLSIRSGLLAQSTTCERSQYHTCRGTAGSTFFHRGASPAQTNWPVNWHPLKEAKVSTNDRRDHFSAERDRTSASEHRPQGELFALGTNRALRTLCLKCSGRSEITCFPNCKCALLKRLCLQYWHRQLLRGFSEQSGTRPLRG
jgi:hypothetical protein